MRYYNLKLNTNADEIKNNSKLENYGYSYQNPVAAVNSYMYQNMKNDFTFLAYREEENFVSATFSYNEKRLRLQDAYDYIMEMLGKAFCMKKIIFLKREEEHIWIMGGIACRKLQIYGFITISRI